MWNTVLRRETEPVLTQDGPYKFSRNPAYCLYILMFQALVLTNPSVLNQLIVMTEIIIMNMLIRAEEKNLKTLF
jgi:protein-S-isoprenylcysteine O-methyltransferase Ste14